MSWKSSIEYERIINTVVQAELGGTHSADLLIRSYDFAAIEALQAAGQWHESGDLLAKDAAALETAGAECIVLCTNTMHVVAEQIEAAIEIPFLHLVDPTAAAAREAGTSTVALLGTRYTMEQDFYRARLEASGFTALIPDEPDRTVVHDVIYDELVRGIVSPASKQAYLEIIGRLLERGATGVIAGCTEIELLVTAEDIDVPYFPTAQLHAEAAAAWSIA